VVYAPVDFETDDTFDALSAGGFDDAAPAMFLWLGVVPYLTLDAIERPCAWWRAFRAPRWCSTTGDLSKRGSRHGN
jgi:O-methyltransferase involved in polyketide biosynthesis